MSTNEKGKKGKEKGGKDDKVREKENLSKTFPFQRMTSSNLLGTGTHAWIDRELDVYFEIVF